MPKGRKRRWCACGCGERLDLLSDYSKRRRYINIAHRQQAARRRKWTAPIRDHQITVTINFSTRAGKLIGVTTQIDGPMENDALPVRRF